MRKPVQYIALAAILAAGSLGGAWILATPKAVLVDDDHDGHDHDGHGHDGGFVKLTGRQMQNAGLVVEQAGPGEIRQRLTLSGVILPDQERLIQISPRFPGVVRAVARRLGDEVKKDSLLVTIESDESLKTYDVLAPMSGTIIDRKVTLGEHVDRSDKMMMLADLSQVWVDFRVFPQDFARLRTGQKVEIAGFPGGEAVEAAISYISPIGVADTQSMLARATVANASRSLRPGLFVTGRVALSEDKARAAVRESAIQQVDGRPVVFVKDGDGFKVSEVGIGRRDGQWAEILHGVEPGDSYVSGNSYILKAELAKAEAVHDHD